VPLLPNAVVIFECEPYGRYGGGDHGIFVDLVLEPHENMAKRGHPLVFLDGRYRHLVVGTAHALATEACILYEWKPRGYRHQPRDHQ